VRQVRASSAEVRSRFTLLMERLIIDLIQQCSTVIGACRIARITWDEAWGVMTRAVARGRARKVAQPIPYIGVDEKAFRKGHRYHTIVCDLERATVEFVAEDRRTVSLAAYSTQLTTEQREGLQPVAMDMWEPYIGATRDGLPDGEARIVFDRFHVMREMTKAVDSGRAWAIKEALRTLWTYRQRAAVTRFFSQWYAWAVRSRLGPVKKVAGMLKRHLDGVLRFVKHPITNGAAEGLNNRIMSIKRKASGFRNPQNFTTAIYFHCGGLDLYLTTLPPGITEDQYMLYGLQALVVIGVFAVGVLLIPSLTSSIFSGRGGESVRGIQYRERWRSS
jgi:transposase